MVIKTNDSRATISLPSRFFFLLALLASSTGKVLELITMPFRAFEQNCSRAGRRNFVSAGGKGGDGPLEPLP